LNKLSAVALDQGIYEESEDSETRLSATKDSVSFKREDEGMDKELGKDVILSQSQMLVRFSSLLG
jgi:hypothetical protein